jgi:glutamyl-tRNA synthetase
MPVLTYKEMGYLPQALVNALARLGWSYGNQERFTVEELIEKFSLEKVGKSPGIFNAEKLLDLNAWHIRNSSDEYLAKELIPFIKKLGIQEVTEQDTIKLVPILKKRSKTLVEMAEKSVFYFGMDVEYEKDAKKNYLTPQVLDLLSDLKDRINKLESFDQKSLEELFIKFLDDHNIKLKEIAQSIRVALTGKTVSPGLFEVMEVLGKEKVLHRLNRAIEHIKKANETS